jgi:integrase
MGTMSGEEASPGLRETGIRERSPGSYELRAYNAEKGRQETTTYVHSRREWGAGIRTARSRRAQLVADIAAGKYGGSKGTLGYLVDAYIDQRERTGASPTTIRGYRSIARAVAAGPGPKKLDKLSSRDLDGWYADLIAGEMTPATVHHHHRLVFAALRQGRKWGWVASNTAELATVPKVPRSELKVPPPARVVALIDHAELSRAPDMATIIVTAALTGLRRGELCGLRWSDIDWHGQTITVQRSVWQAGKDWGVKDPKSHQVRVIPAGPRVLAALTAWRLRAEREARAAMVEVADDAYAFGPDPDQAVPKMPDVISRRFRLHCQALEEVTAEEAEESGRAVTVADRWPYRFHDLRHYQATELIAAGLPMVTVSRRLGHAKVSTTSDIYAHDTDANALLAAGALDSGLAR